MGLRAITRYVSDPNTNLGTTDFNETMKKCYAENKTFEANERKAIAAGLNFCSQAARLAIEAHPKISGTYELVKCVDLPVHFRFRQAGPPLACILDVPTVLDPWTTRASLKLYIELGN